MTDTGAESRSSTAPDSGSHAVANVAQAAAVVDRVCPYLRADDGRWRGAYASRAHRCWATEPPVPLAGGKQKSLCLLSAHEACSTYLAAGEVAGARQAPSTPATTGLWPEVRSTPIVLESPHAVLTPLAGGPARTGGQALLVGLMVLAFIVLVVARTSAPPTSGSPSPGAVAGGGAIASAGSLASPAATVVSTPSPTPSAAPSPTATASAPPPPATPTAAPSARRYKVKSGDTLSGIAARFATTVKAIRIANNLQGNLIRPGQVLIIP